MTVRWCGRAQGHVAPVVKTTSSEPLPRQGSQPFGHAVRTDAANTAIKAIKAIEVTCRGYRNAEH
jgi:hypothetical protein